MENKLSNNEVIVLRLIYSEQVLSEETGRARLRQVARLAQYPAGGGDCAGY